jgi:hypothetical protein
MIKGKWYKEDFLATPAFVYAFDNLGPSQFIALCALLLGSRYKGFLLSGPGADGGIDAETDTLLAELRPEEPALLVKEIIVPQKLVVVTFLYPPASPAEFLIPQSRMNSEGVMKNLNITDQRVVGEIEDRESRKSGVSDMPAITYTTSFSALLFHEPNVPEDLKGQAAKNSPQVKVLRAEAAALKKADFAALRKISTERANREREGLLAQGGAQVATLAREAGEEMRGPSRRSSASWCAAIAPWSSCPTKRGKASSGSAASGRSTSSKVRDIGFSSQPTPTQGAPCNSARCRG